MDSPPVSQRFHAGKPRKREQPGSNARCASTMDLTLCVSGNAPRPARFCAAACVEKPRGSAFLAANTYRGMVRTKAFPAFLLLGSAVVLFAAFCFPSGAQAAVSERFLRGNSRDKKPDGQVEFAAEQVSAAGDSRVSLLDASLKSSVSPQSALPALQHSPAAGPSQPVSPPPPPVFDAATSSSAAVKASSPDYFLPQTSSAVLPPSAILPPSATAEVQSSATAGKSRREDQSETTQIQASAAGVSAEAEGVSALRPETPELPRGSSTPDAAISPSPAASSGPHPSLPHASSALSKADLEFLEATASNKGRTPPVVTSRRPFYPSLLPGANIASVALEKGLSFPSPERKRGSSLPEDHFVHAGPLPKLVSVEETRRAERLLKFQEDERARKGLETLQALLAQPVQTQTVPLLPLKVLNGKEEAVTLEPCECSDCADEAKTKRKDGELGPLCECKDCRRKAEEEARRRAAEKASEEEANGTPEETVEGTVDNTEANETTTSTPSTPLSAEAQLLLKGAELRTADARLACPVDVTRFGIFLGAASLLVPLF
ncbi:putative transmembrane protein [Toxoplasma gondii VAND]|uniref:Putative transmembrane protein n=1 Tax=Toxoplasma gondii VAND TaxID=933077 RepID=A0A086Q8E7_TOXGO|nr:putative transmembrane protein [Toxoplasma gondii VAND]